MGAQVAALQVAAQPRRPTEADVAQSLALFGSETMSPALEQSLFVLNHDVGEFQPLPPPCHERPPGGRSLLLDKLQRRLPTGRPRSGFRTTIDPSTNPPAGTPARLVGRQEPP